MQEYLWKNSFREKMDALGFHFLLLTLCCGWFLLLWGVGLPSFLAGGCLYVLGLLLRHETRDHRLARKEKKLRQRIGGQLKLQQLLFQPPREAHFEAAMLISVAENLTLVRMLAKGVFCKKGEKTLLVSFMQLPSGEKLSGRDVLLLQQAAKKEKAEEVWLCVPCGISEEAHQQAEEEMPVRFIGRDRLIALFGAVSPVTDSQLVAIGKKRKKHLSLRYILHIIFQPEKARRYALYGGMLLLLYALTGLFYYAIPGLICVFFAAFSRCVKSG